MNKKDSAPRKKIIRKRAGEHKRYASGFLYQQNARYFAQISEGLIELGAKELTELGAKDIETDQRGIYFTAEKSVFYRINYCTRLASRILAPLVTFACNDDETLYRQVKRLRWEQLMSRKQTFAVSANVSDSAMDHSQFAALRLKDAVADYFRERCGKRPNVDPREPDLLINLHIRHNQATVSVDASGGSLHKRGYREESVAAPMQETVAAAIINMSEWNGTVPIYDPMCGSGTLLCEALMSQCKIPAGVFRERFGFQQLPDFNPDLWAQVKKSADNAIVDIAPGLIRGSDISEVSVDAARTNIMGMHHGNRVTVDQMDFNDLPPIENSLIVANPPYGIRLGKDQDLELFHRQLGDFLKQKCKGSTAYIYFGDPDYIQFMGLKATFRKPIRAGGLDGRLARYELY